MDRREGLPSIQTLGLDLLITNRFQRWQPIAMPAIWAACFMLAWHWGFFVLSFASLVLAFSASSTSTHDVLHGSLGLKRIQTEWLLFMLGAPILESGHAYRLTHLEHHRSFPSDDDIEGEAAHMPVWRVLLAGPTFCPGYGFGPGESPMVCPGNAVGWSSKHFCLSSVSSPEGSRFHGHPASWPMSSP